MLLALVDQGTDEEAPLLRRAAELRAVIEGQPKPDALARAGDSTDPLDLLCADAFGTGSDTLAGTAREVGAAWLLAAADSYLAQVATHPPDETKVRTAYEIDVRVRRIGPDPGDLATAQSRMNAAWPEPRVPDRGAVAFTVAGALGVGLVAVLPAGLAFLSTMVGCFLVIGAVVRWRAGVRLRTDRRRERQIALTDLDRRVEQAQTTLVALAEQMPLWLRTAREHRAAIGVTLGAPAVEEAAPSRVP
jgi:hypothetical protein